MMVSENTVLLITMEIIAPITVLKQFLKNSHDVFIILPKEASNGITMKQIRQKLITNRIILKNWCIMISLFINKN